MNLTQPIRNPKDVRKFLNYFKNQGQTRNYVLATFGVHSALRISDILNLNTNDVYDFKNKTINENIIITEQKTKKTQELALNKTIISALKAYFPQAKPNTPLILNPKTGKSISRIQAHRIISNAAKQAGLTQKVSCHSLRKTFGYHAWKKGISPAVIMAVYNHSSMATTQTYLSIIQDDKNTAYLGLEFL